MERPFGIVSSSLLGKSDRRRRKKRAKKKTSKKEKVQFFRAKQSRFVICRRRRRRHQKKALPKSLPFFFSSSFFCPACFSTLQIRWDCERQNQKIPRTAPRTSSHKLPVDSECVALSFFFPSLSLSLSLWKAKSSLSSSKCFLTLSLTSLLLHTKLTSKLLRKLEVSNGSGGGAQFSLSSSKHQHQQRQSPPLPSSSSSSSPSPTTQADHYYLQAKPELTQLLQTATKYNEALLKHEQNEIDSLAKYIKEIETVEKNPYEEDYKSESAREKLRAAKSKLEISSRKVKECFEKESSSSETLPTRCRAVVVQYEKCGQEALEAFVAARSE